MPSDVPGYVRGGTKRIRTKRMNGSLKRKACVGKQHVPRCHAGQRTRSARLTPATKEGPPIGWREGLTGSGLAGSELEVVRVRDGLLMVTILSDERMMKAEVRWAGCWDGQLSTAWQSLRGSDGGGRRFEGDSRCSS